MDLVKKKIEIKIDNEEYVMFFDMKSIAIYKEITATNDNPIGNNFTDGINKLFNQVNEEIINFIACTLRHKETEDTPLGRKLFESDILFFLLNFRVYAINLIAESLPQSNDVKKK